MTTRNDLAPGQAVYGLTQFGRGPATWESTIRAIGRKWISLSDGSRFDPETMEVDPGQWSTEGLVFLSEQARSDHIRRFELWEALRAFARNETVPPDTLQLTHLAQAVALLGVNVSPEGRPK